MISCDQLEKIVKRQEVEKEWKINKGQIKFFFLFSITSFARSLSTNNNNND